jgi:hypothetical protein
VGDTLLQSQLAGTAAAAALALWYTLQLPEMLPLLRKGVLLLLLPWR